jgi:hypothetical protein
MTIEEMHVWFRQNAQQMGLQNVRAILPEQIDLLLNTSIYDTVNQIIQQNIGITNDRIITDNSKIGQINALRTLYKVTEVPIVLPKEVSLEVGKTLPFTGVNSPIYKYSGDIAGFNLNAKTNPFTYLYLVDFSIDYGKPKSGDMAAGDEFTSNLYPVRLIDDAYLADSLNDFILRPRLRSPLAVIYNGKMDLYIDKSIDGKGTFVEGLQARNLRISYVAKPAVVRYAADIGGENVDCDLPEYLHNDICKHAIDLYRTSMTGSLYANQQAAQNQQREDYRNNASPNAGSQQGQREQ